MSDRTNDVELAAAAEALEVELARYERIALAIQEEHLGSEASLRRAAQKVGELQASDARLGERVRALSAAIAGVHERHQAAAGRAVPRIEQIGARSQILSSLLAQWETVGQSASRLNEMVRTLPASPKGGVAHRPDPAALHELEEQLCGLAEAAQGLAQAADAERFGDLARHASALRHQLLSALNKLRLLETSAGPTGNA